MKNLYLGTILLLAVLMMLLPLMSKTPDAAAGASAALEAISTALTDSGKPEGGKQTQNLADVQLYVSASDLTKTVGLRDYLFGVVAAEMPALYEEEALKAQTVAAYTYLLYKSERNVLLPYDITDDPNTDQCFITRETARQRWGNSADEYEQKIDRAVEAVYGQKITVDGQPILAVYHAISSGVTENAADLWGGSYGYLVSVDSVGDKLSPNYLSTAEFSPDELTAALSGLAEFSGEPANYFGSASRTAAGSVKTVPLCGKEVSGGSIRDALDLRSSDFDVEYTDGTFRFTVRGYGHGVGMSQYGAHYMAMQGSGYREILTHYYTGCSVE